jgi:hypothetical protein
MVTSLAKAEPAQTSTNSPARRMVENLFIANLLDD